MVNIVELNELVTGFSFAIPAVLANRLLISIREQGTIRALGSGSSSYGGDGVGVEGLSKQSRLYWRAAVPSTVGGVTGVGVATTHGGNETFRCPEEEGLGRMGRESTTTYSTGGNGSGQPPMSALTDSDTAVGDDDRRPTTSLV